MKTGKIQDWISSKLTIFIVIFFVSAAFLCLFSPRTSPISYSTPDSMITDNSPFWFYRIDDGLQNISTYAKENKPVKNKIYHLTTEFSSSLPENYAISFTTKNCLVNVTINDTLQYETSTNDSSSTSDYLGKKVHIVGIPYSAEEQKIDIYLMPITEYDAALIDTVYTGNEEALVTSYINNEFPKLIIAIIIILLGIILMIIGALNHRRRMGQTKFYFGFFAICFGIIAITHMKILTLFFDCSAFLYDLEFLTLALLPYPALCYIMFEHGVLLTLRHNIIRYVPLVNFFIVTFLHLTGIVFFNQSRPVILLMILYFAVVIFYYLVKRHIINKGWKNVKENLSDYLDFVFLAACVTEFTLFHLKIIPSFLVVSHYLLLAILILQLLTFTKEAHALYEIGINAKHLEDAAFFDSLTGLRNRASLNQDIEELEQHLTPNCSIALIQLDINYLKRTNDILGHVAGDRLLKNAASAIRSGFADYGKCYRFGGDEFVIILQNNPKEKYNLGISAMENACERINKNLPPLEHVSIAYGIAYYEPDADTSLWRVQERADVIMYERKRKMKEKHASQGYKDDRL